MLVLNTMAAVKVRSRVTSLIYQCRVASKEETVDAVYGSLTEWDKEVLARQYIETKLGMVKGQAKKRATPKPNKPVKSAKKQTYASYINSAEWKTRRKQRFAMRDGNFCYCCGTLLTALPASQRHIHHLTYERLFNEPMTDLVPACALCNSERIPAIERVLRKVKSVPKTLRHWVATDYIRRQEHPTEPIGPQSILSDEFYEELRAYIEG